MPITSQQSWKSTQLKFKSMCNKKHRDFAAHFETSNCVGEMCLWKRYSCHTVRNGTEGFETLRGYFDFSLKHVNFSIFYFCQKDTFQALNNYSNNLKFLKKMIKNYRQKHLFYIETQIICIQIKLNILFRFYTTHQWSQNMLLWLVNRACCDDFFSGLRIVGWGNSWNLLLHYLQQLHYIAGWTQTNSANQIWLELGCLYLNQFYDRNIRVISMTLASKIKAFQSVWVI